MSPLPTAPLDTRTAQDFVDQAKAMIPRYCPEWTDHNVSDPGVALLELFAWMSELLLYRVNQTPDRMYVKFLDMLGVKLEPPRAARAPVTFYLSAAQPMALGIAEGTEVSTVATETSAAIVFSTERDLLIRPPELIGAFTRDRDRGSEREWIEHDLSAIDLRGHRVAVFSREPNPGDAFYLAFATDLSNHAVAIVADCDSAGGAGVDPNNPPLIWEVWVGGPERWAPCEVEYDQTGGFNWNGEVLLHVPKMTNVSFRDLPAYWMRCRLIDPRPGTALYETSPEIEALRIESRGGTVFARHGVVLRDEVLGRSDGTPGQVFTLARTPVLPRDPATEVLDVREPGLDPVAWSEVTDFANSGANDRHYTVDALDGTVTLGPALLQPGGGVYCFGAIPGKNAELTFRRYKSGGGTIGNVPRGALQALQTTIPYISRIANRRAAHGGLDAQTVEDAKVRAPQLLRTQSRAVTAGDFETLARQVPGVERARCITPLAQPGAPNEPRPGTVILVILPQVDRPEGHVAPDLLAMSAELKQNLETYLGERRLLGTRLEVQPPLFFWLSVEAKLRLHDDIDPAHADDVLRQAREALYRYLNPYVGGQQGTGWPFGRDLHMSEVYGVLQRFHPVEYVEDLRVTVRETATTAPAQAAPSRLTLPPNGLICSDVHRVERT